MSGDCKVEYCGRRLVSVSRRRKFSARCLGSLSQRRIPEDIYFSDSGPSANHIRDVLETMLGENVAGIVQQQVLFSTAGTSVAWTSNISTNTPGVVFEAPYPEWNNNPSL